MVPLKKHNKAKNPLATYLYYFFVAWVRLVVGPAELGSPQWVWQTRKITIYQLIFKSQSQIFFGCLILPSDEVY